MTKKLKLVIGKIIGGERFVSDNSYVLHVSVEPLSYRDFKNFVIKEPAVEIKIKK